MSTHKRTFPSLVLALRGDAGADDLGGGVSGNPLMAAHGGLYRTVDGLSDSVVVGRGQGYAIQRNTKLSDLDQAVRGIRSPTKRK